MIRKEVNIILIMVLAIALVVVGISIYNIVSKKDVIVQEETTEPAVEEPKSIVGEVVNMTEFDEVGPKEVTILIYRYDFDKPEVVIEPGTKVIWKNMDTRRHMIADKRIGIFRNLRKSLEYGDTFEYVFNQTGVYEIIEVNFGINGKVIVTNNANQITGNVVKDMEFSGGSFFLFSINLLVITLALLILGFYISRNRH